MATQSKVHIGLDIGGTKMLAVAYDESYNVLARSRCKTKGNEGKEAVLGRVERSISNVPCAEGVSGNPVPEGNPKEIMTDDVS